MSEFIASARAWLAAITPDLPPALLVVFVFVAVYSIRRWLPSVWLKFEHAVPFVDTIDPGPVLKELLKAWQAIPGALLGTAVAALFAGTSVQAAIWGTVASALAALAHHVMADYAEFRGQVAGQVGGSPPPPAGALGRGTRISLAPPRAPSFPPGSAAMTVIGFLAVVTGIALCLSLSGCGLFGSSGSVWPTVAKCAPPAQNVINSVTQILLGGGDYETQLEQLGEQYGVNVVVCVVDGLVSQWGSPTAKLSAETLDAKGRGQAFLAHAGTKVER